MIIKHGITMSGLDDGLSELNSSPLTREVATEPAPRTSSTDTVPVLKMLFGNTVKSKSKR